MRFGRRVCLMGLLAGLGSASQADEAKTALPKPAATSPAAPKPAAKAAPAPAADDEFLEFLGSVDAEGADGDWMDYLTRTDIEKVAQAKKKAPSTEVKPGTEVKK